MTAKSLPYIAPFAMFMAFLALHAIYPLPDLADQIIRITAVGATIIFFSRPVLDQLALQTGARLKQWLLSIALGIAVFFLWIGPDLLFPNYRHFWLFSNSFLGSPKSTLDAASQMSPAVLILRTVRAVIIVPIVEELFWRAWMMRWLINPDFEKIPLGKYVPSAFWIVAILFASEHGSYWDVGLATGVIYNAWMVRTRSLGNLILTHAITNLALSIYVIFAGKWEYWL